LIETTHISANGIRQHLRFRRGGPDVVVFVHGNGSDSVFWQSTMAALPENYTAYAPDLRGYGDTEARPVDAARSFGSFTTDLVTLIDALQIESYHLVGHSLGGGINWELLIKDANRIRSVTMVNPASPFGFGGSKGPDGKMTFEDGASSGAGVVNPDFVRLLLAKDRSKTEPSSPLNVMNAFYWAPPFVPKDIDDLLEGLLKMQVGNEFYPGDYVTSLNFPFTAPGKFGQLNAASPLSKQSILQELTTIESKPPVLWMRGAKDQIVSDRSLFDTAVHGMSGLIPGYPGAEICPPQPMVAQTRFVLEAYAQNGGTYSELLMAHCAHSPYIEDPDGFMNVFLPFLEKN
jgi:pimeloyl-ACP methyl ester carboxylesterase